MLTINRAVMQHLLCTVVLLLQSVLPSLQSSGTATIGSYYIDYESDRLPSIKISQLDRNGKPGRLLWFSAPSPSPSSNQLLVVEKTQQTVSQNGGDYVMQETVLDTCSTSVLGAFLKNDDNVSIAGQLCGQHNFTISFARQTQNHLAFYVTLSDSKYFNKMIFSYGCEEDEGFYGLGEQYSMVNYKGHSVPLFISEQGVGRGAEPITALFDVISPGSGKCINIKDNYH